MTLSPCRGIDGMSGGLLFNNKHRNDHNQSCRKFNQMPHIDLQNHRTDYQVQGSGKQTIVLIHGLGFDKTGWGPFAEYLSSHFRLVSFDARGIGATDNVYEQFTIVWTIVDDQDSCHGSS